MRSEARRRMAALQGPRPGQGWSETRPTRVPRRALERTYAEDSAPEPAVSSDSDVEVVGDPVVEEREWRLRRAVPGNRIPRGTTDFEGAELPRGHAEAVCWAAEETRKRFRNREPWERSSSGRRRRRRGGRSGCARTTKRQRREEERRLWEEPVEDSWEVPLIPRYAAEEPSPERKSEDGDEPCAPSPPRWLQEVPPTPRYEGEWFANEVRDSDGGAPLASPPWRPARPPTPRYVEPKRPNAQPQAEQSTAQTRSLGVARSTGHLKTHASANGRRE